MLKVVIYCRVSTEEEKQLNALESQINELKSLVKEHKDWILVDEYIDEGKSGTTRKGRAQYNRLFEDISSKKFDLIVIKDQSRLMRNVFDWYQFMNEINLNGILLYLGLERAFYKPEDSFITGIKAMMAAEYSRDLSKKVSSAARRSQKNGTIYGNNAIWGFQRENGNLIIDEKEADIVKLVFSEYVKGNGFRKIGYQLSNMNITSRNGTPFSMSVLKRMIRCEKYKGVLVSGKTKKNFETKKTEFTSPSEWIYINDRIPAIVTPEVWDEANRILKQNSEKFNQTRTISKDDAILNFSGKFSLSGKLICGKCGSQMWHGSYFQSGDKNRKIDVWQCKRYKSFGRNREEGCSAKTVHNAPFIIALKESLFEHLQYPNEQIKDVINSLKIALKENTNKNQLKSLISLKKKKEQQKNKLLDLLLESAISKSDYSNKLDILNLELENIEKDINEFVNNSKVDNIKERIKKIESWLNQKVSTPQELSEEYVAEVIEKIIVYDDYFDVFLNYGINGGSTIRVNQYDKISTQLKYQYVTDDGYKRLHTDILLNTYNKEVVCLYSLRPPYKFKYNFNFLIQGSQVE